MVIVIIRSVILYTLVIVALRLMGKKQLGELQPSELVTTILISNIATLSLEEPSMPMILGAVPILMIVCIDVLMSGIMMKSARFRKIVTGSPRVIMTDGVIDQKEMKNPSVATLSAAALLLYQKDAVFPLNFLIKDY